jgi:protoporphyrinogen oxidase
MGSQVFRTVPDYHKVFSLLNEVCDKSEKIFVIKDTTFRQLLYNEKIEEFYDYLRNFYHKSKQFYLNITRGYSGFLSVLRQLCKIFDVSYISKVVHHHATYTNTLLIYVNREQWEIQPISNTTTVIKSIRGCSSNSTILSNIIS